MSETLTPAQRGAMHRYFELLAQALNDAGYTQDIILTHKLITALEALINLWDDDFYAPQLHATLNKYRPRMAISWTKESVKELWRTLQIPMTGKESTEKLTPGEVGRVHQDFDARIAEITNGVRVEWPHIAEDDQ